MSITDELRTGGIYRFPSNRRVFNEEELTAIADRIDAEAEDNERFRREAGPFCDRLMEAAAERADVTLFGVDYIALPVDSDGVPTRIGDVMEWCDSGETLTVEGIGRDVLFYIDGENAEWTAARNKRHYHAPTVEDVLIKMLEKAVGYSDAHTTVALNAIAEYAAKLRLAEEDK